MGEQVGMATSMTGTATRLRFDYTRRPAELRPVTIDDRITFPATVGAPSLLSVLTSRKCLVVVACRIHGLDLRQHWP